MDAPTVRNVYREPARGNTYVIMAYRPLTEEELILQVRVLISSLKRVGTNKEYTVETSIGLRD